MPAPLSEFTDQYFVIVCDAQALVSNSGTVHWMITPFLGTFVLLYSLHVP